MSRGVFWGLLGKCFLGSYVRKTAVSAFGDCWKPDIKKSCSQFITTDRSWSSLKWKKDMQKGGGNHVLADII